MCISTDSTRTEHIVHGQIRVTSCAIQQCSRGSLAFPWLTFVFCCFHSFSIPHFISDSLAPDHKRKRNFDLALVLVFFYFDSPSLYPSSIFFLYIPADARTLPETFWIFFSCRGHTAAVNCERACCQKSGV